jgi:hypothetical protein
MESGMNDLGIRKVLRVLVLVATVGSCLGQQAMADETRLFEWREPNGVTSYSQTPPPPGTPGVTSHLIETKTLSAAQRAAARAYLAGVDAAERANSVRFRAQLAAADHAVDNAVRALSTAEHAARSGRVPQAGERVGNAGGGSRLRVTYFDRQKQLEVAVEEARNKVDEAYRMRSEIMP